MSLLPTSIPANFSTEAIHGDQNNTNGTLCPQGDIQKWHYTVLPVYILLITVLGLVLNLFVLIVFCFHKKACNVAEIYLSNMAAADLILMTCLPFWAVYAAKKFDWPFDNSMCRVVSLAINMNAYCSIYFLVLISIDRYLALVHPLSSDRVRRTKYAKLSCVLVWGFGLLLGVPTLIYREVEFFSGIKICHFAYPSDTAKVLFDGMLMTFGFIIPIIIISCCTYKIIQALNNRVTERTENEKMEQKATTLMLVVLLAFMICWVPFHVVRFLLTLVRLEVLRECGVIDTIKTCSHVFMYFAFFNSVLNPILYVIVGKNFRNKVRGLFKQWSHRKTTTLNTSSTQSHLLM